MMTSNIGRWLVDTTKLNYPGEDYAMNATREHIICPDGFKVSVQAGRMIYCTPRNDQGPWTEVELGFPSEMVEAWMEWCEDPDDPTGTVYGYVPIDVVENELVRRGWRYP
jgi:hypothetical protein